MAGEGQESSTSATEQDRRENKERRRRERRERRARRQRQRQNDMLHQMDGGHMYDAGCHGYVMDLPDILNSHVPPPPYTTLPGRGHGHVSHVSPTRQNSRSGTWRAAFPGFSRNRWFFLFLVEKTWIKKYVRLVLVNENLDTLYWAIVQDGSS